jgi:hypothetical protein
MTTRGGEYILLHSSYILDFKNVTNGAYVLKVMFVSDAI